MKTYLFLLFLTITTSLNFYDKYSNRDLYSLILRGADIPFYSSRELYSSHYSKMYLNITNYTKNEIKLK